MGWCTKGRTHPAVIGLGTAGTSDAASMQVPLKMEARERIMDIVDEDRLVNSVGTISE